MQVCPLFLGLLCSSLIRQSQLHPIRWLSTSYCIFSLLPSQIEGEKLISEDQSHRPTDYSTVLQKDLLISSPIGKSFSTCRHIIIVRVKAEEVNRTQTHRFSHFRQTKRHCHKQRRQRQTTMTLSRSRIGILGGWLTVLLATFSTTTEGRVQYVRKDGRDTLSNAIPCTQAVPCGTIQAAINVAESGDIIFVGPGTYIENLIIGSPTSPNTKSDITIQGSIQSNKEDGDGGSSASWTQDDENEDVDHEPTIIISAGGVNGEERPMNVSVDIIIDVWSSNVTLQDLHLIHPQLQDDSGSGSSLSLSQTSGGAASSTMNGNSILVQTAVKRDIGIFVGPPSHGFTMKNCVLERKRGGEPFPSVGSRGILVFRATQSVIVGNKIIGMYEDSIHIPSSFTNITDNYVEGATRLGIGLLQENINSDLSNNTVIGNTVIDSGNDGIQIQSNNNYVDYNTVMGSVGAAIKICGIGIVNDCILPFDEWSDATNNYVGPHNNITNNDNIGGDLVDNGRGTILLARGESPPPTLGFSPGVVNDGRDGSGSSSTQGVANSSAVSLMTITSCMSIALALLMSSTTTLLYLIL